MKTTPIAAIAALAGAVVALGATAALHAVAQPTTMAGPPGYPTPRGPAYPQGDVGPRYGTQGEGGSAGGVTLAQFQAHMRNRLMKADTDHDGRISLAEWIAWRTAHPGHGGGAQDPARSFARMDANHDGYITPDEIDAAAARRFARMDTNHDGLLTPEERMAAHHGGGGEGAQGGADDGGVQPINPQ